MKKLLYLVPFFLFPFSFVYAGPGVAWSDELQIDGTTITGFLTVTGIDSSTPPLNLFVFSDSANDFNPHVSSALLGPAINGPISFQAPSVGSTNFFLPVLVDEASYSGSFSPYEDQGQFQVYTAGQVAQILGGGSGGNNDNTNNPPNGNDNTNNNNNNNNGNPQTEDEENTANTVGWPQQVIDNPLQVSDLNSFIVGLLNALLKIGIPIMTLFLVYSGLRLVMARGNEKELSEAKNNLLWVIIGSAILLGAWTIVKILKGTFDEIDIAYINSLISYFS